MIAKTHVTWNKNYSYDGLLYFAQRIVEMLDFKTPDIYKAPLMNSVRLINEFLEVDNDPYKNNHLDLIFSEFRDSFREDIIINSQWNVQKISQILDQLDKNKAQRPDLMKYLYSLIYPHYFNWSLNLIRSYVSQNESNSKIEKVIRCFLPELIYRGYAKEEVLLLAKENFFSSSFNIETSLESFLSNFTFTNHSFDIYIGIDRSLERYSALLANRFKMVLLEPSSTSLFHHPKKYSIVLKRKIEAMDVFHAARLVYQEIDSYTSLYQFIGDKNETLLYNNVLAVREDGKKRLVGANYLQFAFESGNNGQYEFALSEEIVSKIGKNAECALPHLENLIRLHNRAIAQNGLENGFLNFWSVVEVICIGKQESNHIEQIVKIAVPMLKYFYFYSVFVEILVDLKRVLGKDEIQKIFGLSSPINLTLENLANVILLPSNKTAFDKLIDSLLNYPVLRSRINDLNALKDDRKAFYHLAEKYAERIRWHFYRIYRARNSIIHSGKSPNNLKDLGEHLHTYVDILIVELIRRLMAGKACTISDAINDCLLHVDSIAKDFASKSSVESRLVFDICLRSNCWF